LGIDGLATWGEGAFIEVENISSSSYFWTLLIKFSKWRKKIYSHLHVFSSLS
jgi:hypothetical protein